MALDLRSLSTRLEACGPLDRRRLRGLWLAVRQAVSRHEDPGHRVRVLEESLARAESALEARRAKVPAIEYPEELPISQKRAEIAQAIASNQVIVVCGETGSGKTTQLPKICLGLGRGVRGQIGHTQPRRIAARSVAARLAEELHTRVGDVVGYKVRFGDHTSPGTLVKLMTDGVLLAETQGDRALEQYDTIIVDEAHERSLNIDFLLGYLKTLLPRRPDLKVIVTSATIDPEKFSRHFGGAPIIMVSGRTYPVEVIYREPGEEGLDERDEGMQRHIVDAVDEAASYGHGDILVFLSGEREIRETAETLGKHHVPGAPGTEVVPLYAKLSAEDQMRVFRPHDGRRIVLATNVAETSLTVPGIRFVIDTGVARVSRYSARTKVQRLEVEAVSRASADQRKGRCGRIGPGVCFRLFSESDYAARAEFTDPEIVRTNLASVILQMASLRLGAVDEFPFLDPPDSRLIKDGYDTLHELGAVTESHELTPIGRDLARLPIDPRLGRMLLAARDEPAGVLADVLVVTAALSVPDPRERPMDKQAAADEKHAQWRDERSDFLGLLRLWDWYQEHKRHLSGSRLRRACKENFVSFVRLREWEEIHRQVAELMGSLAAEQTRGRGGKAVVESRAAASPAPPEQRSRIGTGVRSSAKPARPARRHPTTERRPLGDPASKEEKQRVEALHRALLTGLLSNIGIKGEQGEYTGARSIKFRIFPGSALFKAGPPWVMASELVRTTQLFARTVAGIDPAWIERLAAHLVKRSYFDPHWDPRAGRVMAFEKVTLFGLELVAKRRTHYGPIDPVMSRELFIRGALVEGAMDTKAPFFEHNHELAAELKSLETRSRRETLLADAERLYAFYDARIPPAIHSAHDFERWYERLPAKLRHGLEMSLADIAEPGVAIPTRADYPDFIESGTLRLPLEYEHKAGDPADGITVRVPSEALSQLPAERLVWLVPGLLHEKLDTILRGLPKDYRRLLPAPSALIEGIAPTLKFGQGSLHEQLREGIRRLTTQDVPRDVLERVPVPDYLRMRVVVEDAQGTLLASGRDLAAIRGELSARLRAVSGGQLTAGAERFNRDGLLTWDLGDLPERVEIDRFGTIFVAYPALVDKATSVSLRLYERPENARDAMRAGLRRLFLLDAGEEVKRATHRHPDIERLAVHAAGLGNPQLFRQSLIELAVDRALGGDRPPPRNPGEFRARSREAVGALGRTVREVCAQVEPVLQSYRAVAARLSSKQPEAWGPAIGDIREQLSVMLPPDFLLKTPATWLVHLPRFLGAIDVRLQRLPGAGLAKDAARMQEITPIWRGYRELVRRQSELGLSPQRIEDYRWMVEELRVSLFAQELRTSVPVSVKRMHDLWEAIVRG